MLIEEVEWIHTKNDIFTIYFDIVEAMLVDQSNQLYIGPILNSLERTDLLKKRSSQVRRLSVSRHQAATMFYMNIQSWKHQPSIRDSNAREMIAGLEDDLKKMTTNGNETSEIEWGLRQLVFERF